MRRNTSRRILGYDLAQLLHIVCQQFNTLFLSKINDSLWPCCFWNDVR